MKAKSNQQNKATKPPRERSPSRFRRTEARRLVRATMEAGLTIARVEVDTNSVKISVIPGTAEHIKAAANEWDEDQTLWPVSG